MDVELPVLLALSPGNLHEQRVETLLGPLARALDAGLQALLLREPGLPDRATLELARRLRAVLGESRRLVLHDRAHLVAACGADALQLGYRSLPPLAARSVVGPALPIGFSAHAHDDAQARAGADFLLLGPVLATPSKQGLLEPLGFERLAQACATETRPVWALGGLKPEHAGDVRAAGARGIAVLSGVLGADDPARADERYLDAWNAAG